MRRLPLITFVLAPLLLAAASITPVRDADTSTLQAGTADSNAYEGLIYGRVTTEDGEVYEGRLRWGGDEEAFWSEYFNGFKDENPWEAHVTEALRERHEVKLFGLRLWSVSTKLNLGRPFMARFGDLDRIEPQGPDIVVTLKSGSQFTLDRYAADDLADGLRIWDKVHGVVDIDEWAISRIQFLSTPPLSGAPDRLHGKVQTAHGAFSGFVQWNRTKGSSADALEGQTADRDVTVGFDRIRAIARHASGGAQVMLDDGSDVVLSGTRETGTRSLGVYVDDKRYGRVLVSWEAFRRVDFNPPGSSAAYEDFPVGGALMGVVTTRQGRRLSGRLVYDLDESETTETLDAPARGIDYTIPFGHIDSIQPLDPQDPAGRARVVLRSGEELLLERSGDLGELNAGLLVFVESRGQPEYIRWADVERIKLDGPRLSVEDR